MRKTITSTALALSLVGGGAAGVALVAPSIASAAEDGAANAESPPQWMTDALDGLVSDGTITQAQADAVAAAIHAAKPEGRPGGPGRLARRAHGLSVAADAIGISTDDLRNAVRSGQTIAEFANANGVDAQVVIDAIVADMQSHLAEAVENGRITQEQADERAASAVDRATAFVNGELPPRPGGEGGNGD